MPDRIFGPSIDASIAVHSCLLPHRILEILTSIGAPVSWYCGRFTSIDGQMFRQEFRLGVLRGAERTLPPWLKVPRKRPQSKSVKRNKIAPEIAIA
jgi:hypothetical protein